MNLAPPAPRVEAATAEKAVSSSAVSIDAARPSEAVHVEKPQPVEPAVAGLKDEVPHQVPRNLDNLSVAALRGTSGADFESKVAVLRGAPKKNILKRALPLFFDERDFVSYGEVLRFVLIKGDCCFVFADDKEPAPLYAIPLDDVYAILEDRKKPDKASVTISPTVNEGMSKDAMVTVLFKYKKNGEQAYQFTFDAHTDKDVANRFLAAINRQAGEKAERGGRVTASVMNAKNTGKVAAKAQPMI